VRAKAKRGRKEDQVDRVYAFEDDWPGWQRNQLTLAECRTLIRSACTLYGVTAPAVRQHKVRSLSYSIPARNII